MTDTVKIPIRVFTSYELLTEYYGDSNLMELGMYEDGDTLVVGHAPNAYSFNPQYFTGETQYVPNYVPDSPFTPPTEEPTTEAPTEEPTTTEAPAGGVADPVITFVEAELPNGSIRLCVNITCETEGATIMYGFPEEGVVPEYYDYYGQLESPKNTVEIDGEKYLIIGNPAGEYTIDECTISAYGELDGATSETVTETYTPGSIPTPVNHAEEPFWIQPEYKANIAILNNLSFPMNIQYSTDKTNWTTITDWNSKICYITSAGQTTTLTYDDGFAGGTKIWFRGTNTDFDKTIFVEGDDDYMLSFNPYMEGSVSFNTGGNIMSLVYGANFTNQTTLPNNMSIGGNGCSIHPFNVMYGPSEYQVNAKNMINSAEELLAISTDWYIDMYDASVETYPIYDIETITFMYDDLFVGSTGLTEIHCTAIYNDTESPCTQFLPTGVAGPNAKFYVNANTQVDWTQLVDTAEWTILIEGTNTPWSPSNN